jgi:hypothetical protein
MAELDSEVEVLAQRFAPTGDPAALHAAAEALDRGADMCEQGRSRAKLWAALFRRKAWLAAGR